MGILVKGATALCGDNLGIIISCINLESNLKKKHVAISYHKLVESPAAGIVNPLKVCTTVNRAEILTKGVSVGMLVVCLMHHMELTGEIKNELVLVR